MDETKKATPPRSGFVKAMLAIDKGVTFAATNVAVLCYALMILMVLYGIVLRFIFRIPNLYGEELSLFLMFCSVSFGIALGIRSRSHLGVDSFVSKLPKAGRRGMKLVVYIIVLATYVLLAYITFRLYGVSKASGSATSALQMPFAVIYLIMDIDYILCILEQLILIWNDFLLKTPVLPEKGAGMVE